MGLMDIAKHNEITGLLKDLRSAQYRTNELLDELLEPVRKQREALNQLAEQVYAQMQPVLQGTAEMLAPETGPGGAFVGGRILSFPTLQSQSTEEGE